MAERSTIQEVKAKPWQNKTFYSFKAGGEWYSSGLKRPPDVGTYIEFDYTTNPKGFKDVKEWNILQGGASPSGTSNAAAGARSLNKDEYWTRKEERDIEVQKRIERQSCRNSAIEVVKILTSEVAGEFIVKPPAQAKRKEWVEAMVDELTTKFLLANVAGTEPKPAEGFEDATPEETAQAVGDWS